MDRIVKCTQCGQIIPAERVEALPGVKKCFACQSGVELAPPPPPPSYSGEFCPRCKKRGIDAPLVWRRPRDRAVMGEFLSCSRYPACLYSDRKSMKNLVCSDHEKASPEQVAWLVQRGISESEARLLTAKEASKQIDKIRGKRRGHIGASIGNEQETGLTDAVRDQVLKIDQDTNVPFSADEEAMFNALKKWRIDQAREEGVPTYAIAHNSGLRGVVQLPARTIEDLRRVKGFGSKRVEKYGEAILSIMNATKVHLSLDC